MTQGKETPIPNLRNLRVVDVEDDVVGTAAAVATAAPAAAAAASETNARLRSQ